MSAVADNPTLECPRSSHRATVEAAAEPAPAAEYLGASLAESGYTPA